MSHKEVFYDFADTKPAIPKLNTRQMATVSGTMCFDSPRRGDTHQFFLPASTRIVDTTRITNQFICERSSNGKPILGSKD